LIEAICNLTIAVLPIGDRYTSEPPEALHAIRLLNTKEVILCTFGQLSGTAEEVIHFTKDIDGLQINVLNA
jgi:hypothetical protein